MIDSREGRLTRRGLMAAAAATGVALGPQAAFAQDTIATTKAGKVRGRVEDGVHVFRSVRYGADTADYRFQPPRPPKPWSDVADCTQFTTQAPQILASGLSRGNNSEDCLFLHVWTPAVRDNKKRPVMVWLHGGSFSGGSGMSPVYDGARLAKRGDVVVVTVNHRLNVFGYLYLNGITKDPRYQDSSNVGQMDIVQALKWVRENAAEFGGDPNNVMIFGQSGGGTKVAFLLGSQQIQGLVHKASIESGSPLYAMPADQATAYTRKFMSHLGLKDGDLGRLATMPMETLVKAITELDRDIWQRPVADGRFLTRDPFMPDAPPWIADIPLIISTMKYEQTTLIGVREPELFNLTWETLPAALAKPYVEGLDVSAVIAEMRGIYPQAKPSDIMFLVSTLYRFRKEALVAAENKVKQGRAPVYMYYMTYESGRDGGKWKSHHAFDNAFIFDNIAKGWSSPATLPTQQKLADMMSSSFVAFAKTGNPNNPLVPNWPPYDTTRRATMVFDGSAKVVNDPDAAERRLAMRIPTIVF